MAASLTTSSLALGSHSLSAAYLGDGNFLPSTSVIVNESIVAATQGDFSVQVGPTSLQIVYGGSGRVMVSLHSVNGFEGPVSLACQNLPSNISCSFEPQTFAISPQSPKLSVLTGAAASFDALISKKPTGSERGSPFQTLSMIFFVPGWMTSMLLMSRKTTPSHQLGLAIACLTLTIGAVCLVGCGLTVNTTNDKITVSAIDNETGSSHKVELALTIKK